MWRGMCTRNYDTIELYPRRYLCQMDGEEAVRRRTFVLALVSISCALARRAAAWTLITPEEFARDQSAPHITPRGLAAPPPGGPVIEVDRPDATKPITTPVTI